MRCLGSGAHRSASHYVGGAVSFFSDAAVVVGPSIRAGQIESAPFVTVTVTVKWQAIAHGIALHLSSIGAPTPSARWSVRPSARRLVSVPWRMSQCPWRWPRRLARAWRGSHLITHIVRPLVVVRHQKFAANVPTPLLV